MNLPFDSVSEKTAKTEDKRLRILCLNGGGVRGLFTISFLAEIERILERKSGSVNVKIGDYFDLISGTSIGGLLALGLASGKSARELESVFEKKAPLIFKKGFWNLPYLKNLKSSILPLYSSQPLKDTIEEMLGSETTFEDLKRRVLIPAVNVTSGMPQFFKTPHNPEFTRDRSIKLVDAAMATSAAPTYFRPHYCESLKAHFVDGGLVANNPSFVSMLEVFKDMKTDFDVVEHQQIHILNIGTLGEKFSLSPKKLNSSLTMGYIGLWSMGRGLVFTTMTSNQYLHKYMLEREMAAYNALENFIYLDDDVANDAAQEITLDNASEGSLRYLSMRGKNMATIEIIKKPSLKALFDIKAKPFK